MKKPFLPFLAAVLLWSAAALAQTDDSRTDKAPAGAAAAASLTPAQAQQALEVLQDPQKREQLIGTLKTIAQALPPPQEPKPAPAPAPTPKSPVQLAPDSLGAQLVAHASRWVGGLSEELVLSARAVTDFPLIWGWMVYVATDPAARDRMLDAGWRLALVLGSGLFGEWLARRAIRWPREALRRWRGPEPRKDGTWHVLQLLPWALATLVLDLVPVAAFAALALLLLGTEVGSSPTMRLIIFTVAKAYVLWRGVLCITRDVVSPANSRLRLVRIDNEAAAYVEIWIRRIATVAVFGAALAEATLLLGLYEVAYEALIKLVALVVHLMLVIIVLQCRQGLAKRLRAPHGTTGRLAMLRNRLADIWHYPAIFFILAFWVVWAIQIRDGFSRLLQFSVLTMAVLVLGRLLGIVALGALDRVFRVSPGLAVRFPGIEGRASRYYPLVRGTVSVLVQITTLLALLEAWGVDAVGWFASGKVGGRLLSAATTIAVACVISVAVWEGANAAMERHLARLAGSAQAVRAARLRTLLPMMRATLLIAILSIVGLTALSEIGVNIAPLLAGAGIVGIAVGFGSQKLVQDVITGLFLLLEDAMQVGDWVTVAGLSGAVENLSIRTIRLRAGDGSVHIIPFSSVTSVNNTNRGLGNAAVSVNIGYAEDTDRVGEVLAAIAREMRSEPAFAAAMLSDLQLWGVDKVDASVVTITGQIVCTAAGRWNVQREFNRRLKIRFQELGIEIANPTRTVVLRQEQPAPPAPKSSPP